MADRAITVPEAVPPRWFNALMKVLLRTPGVQSRLGRSFALLTWTGRRSGRRFTTPVAYTRDNAEVVVVTKRSRSWWLNFADRPEVELRLAGDVVRGNARARLDDEATLPKLIELIERTGGAKRYYGIEPGPDGRIDEADARAILPQLAVIEVALD